MEGDYAIHRREVPTRSYQGIRDNWGRPAGSHTERNDNDTSTREQSDDLETDRKKNHKCYLEHASFVIMGGFEVKVSDDKLDGLVEDGQGWLSALHWIRRKYIE